MSGISKAVRSVLALSLSALATAFAVVVTLGPSSATLGKVFAICPTLIALSLLVGGPIYFVMRKVGIRRSIVVCLLAGLLVGLIPGVMAWAISSPPPNWPDPEAVIAEARLYPMLTGAYGLVGGAAFFFLERLVKLD